MTRVATTQSDVYRLFEEIDRIPGIIEPRLGRWRAWPIAKMHLVWHLMYPESMRPDTSGFVVKLRERLKHSLSDLSVVLRQVPRLMTVPGAGSIGMLYLPRIHRSAGGQPRDAIFGDLLMGAELTLPIVGLELRPWSPRIKRLERIDPAIHLDAYQSAAEFLAVCLLRTRAVRNAGSQLDELLARANLPIEAGLRRHKVLLGLAHFEARRRLFTWLLKRLATRVLVLTYGPGRTGEIAAAKELGIPTIELQHGVISSHCPDYAWPSAYAPFKEELPLPDHVALFGPVFRREIMQSGFWVDRETSAVGSAAIADYRRKNEARERKGKARLLYMTQATVRDTAIAFWREFLLEVANETFDCEVVLKLHPEEQAHHAEYNSLVALAPGRVKVLPPEVHPFEAMLDSDVVVSYNSMSLVEALGLGKPAISLCGGTIPGGFSGTFDLPELASVMPHVKTPKGLAETLRDRLQNDVVVRPVAGSNVAIRTRLFFRRLQQRGYAPDQYDDPVESGKLILPFRTWQGGVKQLTWFY